MKRLLLAFAIFASICGSATAQCNGVFAAGSVCGSAAGGIPGQIPNASIPGILPLPNTQIYVGNVSGVAAAVAMSNDCTIANTGAITCTKTNGVAFGSLATQSSVLTGQLPAPFTNGTASGNTSKFGSVSGTLTTGDCVQFDASGNLVDAGAACSSGGGTPQKPGGRLTLVSGQPEMTADVTSQNVYYAPDEGNTCPIFNGTTWASYQFTSSTTDQVGLTLALAGSANWPAGTIFDVFCVLNAGVPVLGTRAWDASMLPTFTQISSNALTTIQTGTSGATWTNPANAFNGTLLQSSATAAATNAGNSTINNCLGQDMGVGVTKVLTKVAITSPTDTSYRGDNPNTVVMSVYGSLDNTNWQRLDASRNVLSTAAVESTTYTFFMNPAESPAYRYFRICTTGNGANANRFGQIQFFTTTPPTTRRLQRFNGIIVNDATITARISASTTISVPVNQATYLGSFQTDVGTAGQVTANFNYGINRVMNIWNYYNQKKVTLIAGIAPTSSAVPASAIFNYALTWPAWQDWQGVQSSTSYSIQVLVGYTGNTVEARFARAWYITGTTPGAYEFGIGLDTVTNYCGSEGGLTGDTTGNTSIGYFGVTNCNVVPFFGTHTFFGIERLTYQPTATVNAFMNIGNTGLYVTTFY